MEIKINKMQEPGVGEGGNEGPIHATCEQTLGLDALKSDRSKKSPALVAKGRSEF